MANSDTLREQYSRRFEGSRDYRDRVWRALLRSRLHALVGAHTDVLVPGCGSVDVCRHVGVPARFVMARISGPARCVVVVVLPLFWPLLGRQFLIVARAR